MAIPAYKNISGFSIDVPTDSGASQRVPAGSFVKGTYFATIFDAHTTTVDGVTKTFAADSRWTKTSDWSGLSADEKALIVVDNVEGVGNRLQLVDVPATSQADGIEGQIAQDGATLYLCTKTGTGETNDYVESLTSGGGHTALTLSHTPVPTDTVVEVKTTAGVVLSEGVTADASHYTVSGTTVTFGAAVAGPYTYVVTYTGNADRWARGTMAAW